MKSLFGFTLGVMTGVILVALGLQSAMKKGGYSVSINANGVVYTQMDQQGIIVRTISWIEYRNLLDRFKDSSQFQRWSAEEVSLDFLGWLYG
mgnify:CR=1 FL=1